MNQMTPRQLRAFTTVAQTLSFARACERLHLSQPALSLAIRNLENSLGGRLLIRTTRQVRLTPEGAALLPRALRLLADWDNLQERLRQRFTLQRGHVTIAAMPTFASNVLPKLLHAYRASFPNVEVSVHDVVNEQVLEMVESGRVEMGVGFEPESTTVLAFECLTMDRFMAIVPADSPLGSKKSVTWAHLLSHAFVTLQRPSSMRRLLEDSLTKAGMQLPVTLECHQLTTVGHLVAQGLGVSVVPSICRSQMEAMGARCLRLSRPSIRKAIGLITRNDQELSTAASAVRAVMRASFGSAQQGSGAVN